MGSSNLNVDAVELVEAAPRPGERETLEELPHHDVVHLRGAVEDHALLRQRLGQVLRRLGLPGPRRARRGPAEVQVVRAHEGDVT